jgi:hypothetical protein
MWLKHQKRQHCLMVKIGPYLYPAEPPFLAAAINKFFGGFPPLSAARR